MLRAEVKTLLDKNVYHIEKIENTARANTKKLISEVFKSAWPKFDTDLKLLAQVGQPRWISDLSRWL